MWIAQGTDTGVVFDDEEVHFPRFVRQCQLVDLDVGNRMRNSEAWNGMGSKA
jgi:hypothetical protein